MLVGVGKGNQTKPIPITSQAQEAGRRSPPTDRLGCRACRSRTSAPPFRGAFRSFRSPTTKALAAYTETVYKNCPYSDKLLADAPYPSKTAIPTRVGDPSPIKHVIYIIKENRTYDQVFGDITRGNGDPSLVMFGEQVTPNHHELAEEFVLLDNLYCNGHVSADGHPWSTMAYNTDYVARDWAPDLLEPRAGSMTTTKATSSKAPSGYLWDACARNGSTIAATANMAAASASRTARSGWKGRSRAGRPHVPRLRHHQGARAEPRDTDNVDVFLEGIPRISRRNGNLPRFIVMSLGEDHTDGHHARHVHAAGLRGQQRPGAGPAGRGRQAQQVLARDGDLRHRGRRPERPRPRRRPPHRRPGDQPLYPSGTALDSTQYSTVSMMRTMELILGLPPLSQFDAARGRCSPRSPTRPT